MTKIFLLHGNSNKWTVRDRHITSQDSCNSCKTNLQNYYKQNQLHPALNSLGYKRTGCYPMNAKIKQNFRVVGIFLITQTQLFLFLCRSLDMEKNKNCQRN